MESDNDEMAAPAPAAPGLMDELTKMGHMIETEIGDQWQQLQAQWQRIKDMIQPSTPTDG